VAGRTEGEVLADLKASLGDAAGSFAAAGDADFKRHLRVALVAMQEKRPRTLVGEVQLTADQPSYSLAAVPAFAAYKSLIWGGKRIRPWEPFYPGALPRVQAVQDSGSYTLFFDPPPSSAHVAAFGTACKFWYWAEHSLGATAAACTLAAADLPLLVLRAQAEAMRELSLRNSQKVVQMRDGYSGAPRNVTPAALYAALLKEWQDAR
jgi:hypothetical protein